MPTIKIGRTEVDYDRRRKDHAAHIRVDGREYGSFSLEGVDAFKENEVYELAAWLDQNASRAAVEIDKATAVRLDEEIESLTNAIANLKENLDSKLAERAELVSRVPYRGKTRLAA